MEDYSRYGLAASLCVLSLISVTGNLLVGYILLQQPFKPNISILVSSLVLCDLMTSLVDVPVTVTTVILDRWVFGTYACQVLAFTTTVIRNSAHLHLMLMMMDRYLAILVPCAYKAVATRRAAYIAVATIWITTGIVTALGVLPTGDFDFIAPMYHCGIDPQRKFVHFIGSRVLYFILPVFLTIIATIRLIPATIYHSVNAAPIEGAIDTNMPIDCYLRPRDGHAIYPPEIDARQQQLAMKVRTAKTVMIMSHFDVFVSFLEFIFGILVATDKEQRLHTHTDHLLVTSVFLSFLMPVARPIIVFCTSPRFQRKLQYYYTNICRPSHHTESVEPTFKTIAYDPQVSPEISIDPPDLEDVPRTTPPKMRIEVSLASNDGTTDCETTGPNGEPVPGLPTARKPSVVSTVSVSVCTEGSEDGVVTHMSVATTPGGVRKYSKDSLYVFVGTSMERGGRWSISAESNITLGGGGNGDNTHRLDDYLSASTSTFHDGAKFSSRTGRDFKRTSQVSFGGISENSLLSPTSLSYNFAKEKRAASPCPRFSQVPENDQVSSGESAHKPEQQKSPSSSQDNPAGTAPRVLRHSNQPVESLNSALPSIETVETFVI